MQSLAKALGSAIALTATCTVNAGSYTFELDAPAQLSTLHVIVAAGMTSSCGLREAPHLIEHLLLSDTSYGDSPVDAMLTLQEQGVRLRAYTLLDFTQYSLTGPVDKTEFMADALAEFIGRPSIPRIGFEREKKAVVSELRQDDGYVSTGSFFERFVAAHAEGPAACLPDSKPFMQYDHAEVDEVFRQLYTADNIYVAAEGLPQGYDLDGLRQRIIQGKPMSVGRKATPTTSQPIPLISPSGVSEFFFPIQGRGHLSEDAASAMADRMRLVVQSYIRRELGLYSARSFVDQGITAGWIRLEVPGLPVAQNEAVANIAQAAAQQIKIDDYGRDVVWHLMGSIDNGTAPVRQFVAEQSPKRVAWWQKLISKFLNYMGF